MKSSLKNDYITDSLARDLVPGDMIVGYFIDAGTTEPLFVTLTTPIELVISVTTQNSHNAYIDITTIDSRSMLKIRWYSRDCPFRIYKR